MRPLCTECTSLKGLFLAVANYTHIKNLKLILYCWLKWKRVHNMVPLQLLKGSTTLKIWELGNQKLNCKRVHSFVGPFAVQLHISQYFGDPFAVSAQISLVLFAVQAMISAWVITLLSVANGHLSECQSKKSQIWYILPLYNATDYFRNQDVLRFDAL